MQDPNNQDRCIQATCTDGTPINTCSNSKPQYCTSNQVLVERPNQCGCPADETLLGSSCVSLQSTCTLQLNPNTIRNGETIVATVNYDQYQNKPNGFIDCGNGQISQLTCTGNTYGTCTTTCTYNNPTLTSANAKAYLNANLCSSANLQINGNAQLPPANAQPNADYSRAVFHITDCETGENLQGATISITPVHLIGENNGRLTSDIVNTNQNGAAQIAYFQQGLYDAFITKDTYIKESTTISLVDTRVQVTNICLHSTQYPRDDAQPGLQPAKPQPQEPQNPTLHILAMRAPQLQTKIYPGQEKCIDLYVQNKGTQPEQVNANALNQGDFEVKFEQDAFELGPNSEKKIQTCILAPINSQNLNQLQIQFSSQAAQVTQPITLSTKTLPQLESNNCIQVDNTKTLQYIPVEITNPSETNNFDVEVDSNDINARAVTPAIFNFKQSTTRAITLAVSPKEMPARIAHATLRLKDEQSKTTVLETNLCFQATYDSNGATAGLSNNFLKITAGQTAVTFLKIRNTGNLPSTYTISSIYDETEDRTRGEDSNQIQGIKITLSTTQTELKAGEEKEVKITLQPSNNLANAIYTIPIYVYAQNQEQDDELIATPTITASIQELATTNTLELNPQTLEIQVNENTNEVKLKIQIQNTENKPRTITAGLQTLPDNWQAQVQPAQMQLQSGQIGTFEYTLNAPELKQEDTSATIKLTDELGRIQTTQIPIPLKTKQLIATPTGLFTLNEGNTGLITGLLFILSLAGIFLFIKAYAARKELSLTN